MTDGKPIRPIRRDELRKFKHVCVVFGSRKYKDLSTFEACLLGFIEDNHLTPENTVFLSGMAKNGPDAFIVDWCKKNGWRWSEFPADWANVTVPGAKIKQGQHGPYNALAGFMRNQEMANVSTHGLGYWDGHSPGTKDMIDRCNEKKITMRVIRVKEEG